MNEQGKTVLIIEDDAEILNFAARLLQLEKFKVIRASNGEEGLKLAQDMMVDIILLDLRLPGLNGWTLLDAMSRDPRLSQVPKLVFSAAADAPTRERALKMGARQYLIKPVSAQELKEAIKSIS